MTLPEPKSRTEQLDIQRKTEAIVNGSRPADKDYPYIPPDRVWHTISWQGSSELRALWNKPVRIRFHLHEVSLYSFQFITSESEAN